MFTKLLTRERHMMKMNRLFGVLLAAALASAQAFAQDLPTDPSIQVFKLANGLTCWLKHNETPPEKVSILSYRGRTTARLNSARITSSTRIVPPVPHLSSTFSR